jgi:DNA-binding beta-propeller fold protein YncE
MTQLRAINRRAFHRRALATGAAGLVALRSSTDGRPVVAARNLIYVAVPGIRDYLEYGGHGVLVFDVEAGHKFLRRIPAGGKDAAGKPMNVKGIAASAKTKRLYVSTIRTLECFDLTTDKLLWEKTYDGGCDRMSIAPDGSHLYVPSFEGPFWNVVSGEDGAVIGKIVPDSGAHNTVYGPLGKFVYLAGLKSPLLTLADPKTHKAARTVGPFGGAIRPFTVDGGEKRVYACVNGLLGFEVGDLTTGKLVKRVEVQGFKSGPVKRHGCPSHGIGLTPDGRQIWLCDSFNHRLHVFAIDGDDVKPVATIEVRDEPGWVTFSIDGKRAYPSTGEVIDVATRKTITTLADEAGKPVQSEKLLEIVFDGDTPTRAGDQFGRGLPETS